MPNEPNQPQGSNSQISFGEDFTQKDKETLAKSLGVAIELHRSGQLEPVMAAISNITLRNAYPDIWAATYQEECRQVPIPDNKLVGLAQAINKWKIDQVVWHAPPPERKQDVASYFKSSLQSRIVNEVISNSKKYTDVKDLLKFAGQNSDTLVELGRLYKNHQENIDILISIATEASAEFDKKAQDEFLEKNPQYKHSHPEGSNFITLGIPSDMSNETLISILREIKPKPYKPPSVLDSATRPFSAISGTKHDSKILMKRREKWNKHIKSNTVIGQILSLPESEPIPDQDRLKEAANDMLNKTIKNPAYENSNEYNQALVQLATDYNLALEKQALLTKHSDNSFMQNYIHTCSRVDQLSDIHLNLIQSLDDWPFTKATLDDSHTAAIKTYLAKQVQKAASPLEAIEQLNQILNQVDNPLFNTKSIYNDFIKDLFSESTNDDMEATSKKLSDLIQAKKQFDETRNTLKSVTGGELSHYELSVLADNLQEQTKAIDLLVRDQPLRLEVYSPKEILKKELSQQALAIYKQYEGFQALPDSLQGALMKPFQQNPEMLIDTPNRFFKVIDLVGHTHELAAFQQLSSQQASVADQAFQNLFLDEELSQEEKKERIELALLHINQIAQSQAYQSMSQAQELELYKLVCSEDFQNSSKEKRLNTVNQQLAYYQSSKLGKVRNAVNRTVNYATSPKNTQAVISSYVEGAQQELCNMIGHAFNGISLDTIQLLQSKVVNCASAEELTKLTACLNTLKTKFAEPIMQEALSLLDENQKSMLFHPNLFDMQDPNVLATQLDFKLRIAEQILNLAERSKIQNTPLQIDTLIAISEPEVLARAERKFEVYGIYRALPDSLKSLIAEMDTNNASGMALKNALVAMQDVYDEDALARVDKETQIQLLEFLIESPDQKNLVAAKISLIRDIQAHSAYNALSARQEQDIYRNLSAQPTEAALQSYKNDTLKEIAQTGNTLAGWGRWLGQGVLSGVATGLKSAIDTPMGFSPERIDEEMVTELSQILNNAPDTQERSQDANGTPNSSEIETNPGAENENDRSSEYQFTDMQPEPKSGWSNPSASGLSGKPVTYQASLSKHRARDQQETGQGFLVQRQEKQDSKQDEQQAPARTNSKKGR